MMAVMDAADMATVADTPASSPVTEYDDPFFSLEGDDEMIAAMEIAEKQ